MGFKSNQVIRLLIVDDYDNVRMGLRVFLETCEGLEVIGEANSGQQALELCGKLHPQLVLLDLIMPGMNGADTAKAIHQQYPHIHILMLTSSVEWELINEAMQVGAVGYIPKSSGREIIETINALFQLNIHP